MKSFILKALNLILEIIMIIVCLPGTDFVVGKFKK